MEGRAVLEGGCLSKATHGSQGEVAPSSGGAPFLDPDSTALTTEGVRTLGMVAPPDVWHLWILCAGCLDAS